MKRRSLALLALAALALLVVIVLALPRERPPEWQVVLGHDGPVYTFPGFEVEANITIPRERDIGGSFAGKLPASASFDLEFSGPLSEALVSVRPDLGRYLLLICRGEPSQEGPPTVANATIHRSQDRCVFSITLLTNLDNPGGFEITWSADFWNVEPEFRFAARRTR